LMIDQDKCAVFGRVLTFHLVLLAALVRHRLPLSLCVMVTKIRNSRQFFDRGLDACRQLRSLKTASGTATGPRPPPLEQLFDFAA